MCCIFVVDFPCTTDDCCASSPLINDDVGAHADDACPTSVGDKSLIGCVEFTGCRYDVQPCETDECCEASPLRNPDLPVEFNAECPQENGDPSHGGCIEFTRCKYVGEYQFIVAKMSLKQQKHTGFTFSVFSVR